MWYALNDVVFRIKYNGLQPGDIKPGKTLNDRRGQKNTHELLHEADTNVKHKF